MNHYELWILITRKAIFRILLLVTVSPFKLIAEFTQSAVMHGYHPR